MNRKIDCPKCPARVSTPHHLIDVPDGILACPKCYATICPVHEIPLTGDDECAACAAYVEAFGDAKFERHCKEVYRALRRD